MTKFMAGAAVALAIFALLLLATNNAGNPAVLSTVEYGINTDAAIADRAAERTHNERMAEIEAERLRTVEQERTNRWLIVAGVVAVAMASGALASTFWRPTRIVQVLQPPPQALPGSKHAEGLPFVVDIAPERRIEAKKEQERTRQIPPDRRNR